MNCNILLIIFCVIITILIIILLVTKSTFGGPYDDTYASAGCMRDNRSFPEGNVPGSWLGMTTAEKNNIIYQNNLTNFVKNSSVI